MEQEFIHQPMIQYGFAGFATALLGIIVWLITKVLCVVDKNTKALVGNMEAITEVKGVLKEVSSSLGDHTKMSAGLRDEIIRRPCLCKSGK